MARVTRGDCEDLGFINRVKPHELGVEPGKDHEGNYNAHQNQ